jgi:hypothetical protein
LNWLVVTRPIAAKDLERRLARQDTDLCANFVQPLDRVVANSLP